jgi:hypothetical protein
MARQSKAQKETVARVMHEFKHGELKIRGTGPKVKNPRQAIAIALHEAGATNQESPQKNKATLRKTKSKERKGETAQAGWAPQRRARARPQGGEGRQDSAKAHHESRDGAQEQRIEGRRVEEGVGREEISLEEVGFEEIGFEKVRLEEFRPQERRQEEDRVDEVMPPRRARAGTAPCRAAYP